MGEVTLAQRTTLSFRRRFLYSVVLLAILAVLLELFTRIVEALTPEHAPLPGLVELNVGAKDPPHVWVAPDVWIRNPASTSFAPHGIRDHKREIPKPPGVRRVLIIGDSVTFGMGVKKS